MTLDWLFGYATKLPETWAVAALDEVAEIGPSAELNGLPETAPVHFVPMAAVSEDFRGINVEHLRPLGEVRKGFTSFMSGDVLLAKITPCMENGKGGLVPHLSNRLGYGSTEFHVLRSALDDGGPWLAQFLSQPIFRKFARANMTGTAGQMRVPTKWLRTVDIPVPPFAEQSRIVAKLEELLSDLDAGVAELKAAQKKLAQYRQSLLKAAVEGALTAEWREKQKTVRPEFVEGLSSAHGSTSSPRTDESETGSELLERILQERRARWEAKQLAKFAEQGKTPPKDWQKKYPEPVQPETTSLPELPEGWVWATIDQMAEVFLGKMLDKTKHMSGTKMPYLRNVNVRWGNIETHDVSEMFFENDELERYGLIAGDVLVCEGGEPGRAAICKKEHEVLKYQKALHRVRLFDFYQPELLVAFLEHVAKTGRLDKTFTGSTINHFTKESFLALHIPLAPVAEQTEIVEVLSAAMVSIDDQSSSIEFALKQSTAQRQNILRAAFAGQLVPQDPNDEPASVLLERIRAERAARETVKKPRGRRVKESV